MRLRTAPQTLVGNAADLPAREDYGLRQGLAYVVSILRARVR
jgi:hypothetical protein